MSDELKDILLNKDKNIEQEKLLLYLNSALPDSAQHELEKQMIEDDFMNDAVEGLQDLKNRKDIPVYVQQLNSGLKKQLDKKKKREDKRKISSSYLIYFSVIIVLILLVLAYIILKRLS